MVAPNLSHSAKRALQAAGLATLLAAASLRADEPAFQAGLDYRVALAAANTGSPLAATSADPRPARPAAEAPAAASLDAGYELAPGLALEGTRVNLSTAMPAVDNPMATPAERAAVWSISSVGSVPLDAQLSVFARLGLHYPEGQAPSTGSAQRDDLGQVYGLGLRFAPSERVDLRAELQRFTRVGPDGATDASTMLFGARVRF